MIKCLLTELGRDVHVIYSEPHILFMLIDLVGYKTSFSVP